MSGIITAAIVAAFFVLSHCTAAAHDGVPLAYQPMCCVDECAAVDDEAVKVDDFTYRLKRRGEAVPPGRTFFSTNGKTIVCPYSNGGIRCLFIPAPEVS